MNGPDEPPSPVGVGASGGCRKRKAEDNDNVTEAGTSAGTASGATANATPCRTTNANAKGRRLVGAANLLTKLFGPDSTTSPGLELRASPSSDGDPTNANLGVYATADHAPNAVIGGRSIPTTALLDPLVVLRHHPLARRAVEVGGATPSFAFWVALASMGMELEAATATGRIGAEAEKGKFASHDDYLRSLPRESPEPCSWSEEERDLLVGTQLAKQVEGQLRLLREEYDRVVAKLSEDEDDDDGTTSSIPPMPLPPFDVEGRGRIPSLLWARGCHISRSFPRSLVDAANVSSDDAKKSGGDGGDGSSALLTVQLGGYSVPKVSYSGPVESSSAPSPSTNTPDGLSQRGSSHDGGTSPPDPSKIAGTLGVMFPFYDMLDHRPGHKITWEAGGGTIRFRCADEIKAGEQICNNYGPKGNQELLFTYGFAIEGNPLDSVDGIVFGCQCPEEEEGDDEGIKLHEARLALLQEHDVPHKIESGALMMGPFALFAKLPTTDTEVEEDGGEGQGRAEEVGEREAEEWSVMPQELLFALSVLGMEDVEEGPGLSPYEIDMLQHQFGARIRSMNMSGDENGSGERIGKFSRAGFVAAYKRGQVNLLQSAIADLDAMVGGEGGEGGEEG
eukprot:CAMPEP_0181037672 /NCGR_PEP_ID=MMETSP1070-20121207/9529_1 /TAXON_ID=265543 /ORGANISM="Minutocellus polymorphus, Strain NH13" /LENGTH=620 /DNA_ID=CAMNT_0023115409 /DNA_START=1 /DNA_END=1863 /DNA_ORIENTATION=+